MTRLTVKCAVHVVTCLHFHWLAELFIQLLYEIQKWANIVFRISVAMQWVWQEASKRDRQATQGPRHVRARAHAWPSWLVFSLPCVISNWTFCARFSEWYTYSYMGGRGRWFKSLPSTQECYENELFFSRKLVMQTSLLTKNSIISGHGRFVNLYQRACLTCFSSLRGKNRSMAWHCFLWSCVLVPFTSWMNCDIFSRNLMRTLCDWSHTSPLAV